MLKRFCFTLYDLLLFIVMFVIFTFIEILQAVLMLPRCREIPGKNLRFAVSLRKFYSIRKTFSIKNAIQRYYRLAFWRRISHVGVMQSPRWVFGNL